MAIINIPNKSAGDTYFSEEMNEIVNAIKMLQESTGWGIYYDTEFTDIAPQMVPDGSPWTAVENNAGSEETTYLPIFNGAPFDLYDGDKFRAPSVGSIISGWINITAELDTMDSYFELSFDIGGAFNQIFIHTLTVPRGKDVAHEYTIAVTGGVGDTFFTNGGIVQVRPKSGSNLKIWGAAFYFAIDSQPA
jgi:hypothetical protein